MRTSSIRITGALRARTAIHSSQFRGAMTNRSANQGTYRIPKCKTMLRVIAPTRYRFLHRGNLSRDSFSESEFMALNISTVTRMERDMVVAVFDSIEVGLKTPQLTVGKRAEH